MCPCRDERGRRAIFVARSPRAGPTPHLASQRTLTAAPTPTRRRTLAPPKPPDCGPGALASASQYHRAYSRCRILTDGHAVWGATEAWGRGGFGFSAGR